LLVAVVNPITPSPLALLLQSSADILHTQICLKCVTFFRNGGLRSSAANYHQLNGGGPSPYGRFQEFGDAWLLESPLWKYFLFKCH
jgi:hypothetical protein